MLFRRHSPPSPSARGGVFALAAALAVALCAWTPGAPLASNQAGALDSAPETSRGDDDAGALAQNELTSQDFLLSAVEIDVEIVEGEIETLNARHGVMMLMGEPDAAAEGDAPPGRPEPAAGAGGDNFLGRDFRLLSEALDIAMDAGEIASLIAAIDVDLEMDDLRVTGVRLFYNGQTKILTVWGDSAQSCVVESDGARTVCDEFVYYTETGESEIRGSEGGSRPSVELQGDRNLVMSGDDVQINRDEQTGNQRVTVRGSSQGGVATIGSRRNADDDDSNP